MRPLRIGVEKKERKKKEETASTKYNGLPYWAAITNCKLYFTYTKQ